MFLNQLFTNGFLFCISILGVGINRRNILVLLMCIELGLLSVNLNFIIFSIYFDDIYGEIFSLFILTVAASESAIGLAIIILYYRSHGSITTSHSSSIRG